MLQLRYCIVPFVIKRTCTVLPGSPSLQQSHHGLKMLSCFFFYYLNVSKSRCKIRNKFVCIISGWVKVIAATRTMQFYFLKINPF
jgi:hypothetical protein